MADIMEKANLILPYELMGIVSSFLGEAPSGKIMNEYISQQEFILTYIDENRFEYTFCEKWKLVKSFLNLILTRKRNGVEILIKLSDLRCQDCNIKCQYFKPYLEYNAKCYWCHCDEYGHEYFECEDCGVKTEHQSDLYATENGLYCVACLPESEDEESENENDDEFW